MRVVSRFGELVEPVESGVRREAERLLHLAAFLEESDRALIELVLDRGLKMALVAKAARADRRALGRRVHRLLVRLASPVYAFVAANHRGWHQTRREVARTIILHGLTQRQAAGRLDITCHRVRSELAAIRAQFELARQAAPHASRSLSA